MIDKEGSFSSSFSPEAPECPTFFNQELRELKEVGECLDYLIGLSEKPNIRDKNVLILAEPILDVYLQTDNYRLSREGSFDEAQVEEPPQFNLGGGLNAVRGLSSFTENVFVISRVSGDHFSPYNEVLHQLLSQLPENVHCHLIDDPESNNAVKIRIINSQGEVVDGFAFVPKAPSKVVEEKIIETLKALTANPLENLTLQVADYGRGLCSPRIMEELGKINLPKSPALFIDPRPTDDFQENRGKYNLTGAVLTPNRKEAEQLSGIKIPPKDYSAAQQSAKTILENYPNLHGIVITLDEDGAVYLESNGDWFVAPPRANGEKTINPSGAGDVVIDSLVILTEKFGIKRALEAAMMLAGTSVKQPGTSTLSLDLIKQTKAYLLQTAYNLAYEKTSKTNNGNIFPEQIWEAIKEFFPDSPPAIRSILKRPDAKEALYSDVESFLKEILERGWSLSIWTQGETSVDGQKSVFTGYQMAKLASLKLTTALSTVWKEKNADPGLPRVICGIDKTEVLANILSRLNGRFEKQIVVIDDNPEKLSQAGEVFRRFNCQPFLILVDRREKYKNFSCDGLLKVNSFDEINLDCLPENCWFLVDLDYTLIDHKITRAQIGRRIQETIFKNQ